MASKTFAYPLTWMALAVAMTGSLRAQESPFEDRELMESAARAEKTAPKLPASKPTSRNQAVVAKQASSKQPALKPAIPQPMAPKPTALKPASPKHVAQKPLVIAPPAPQQTAPQETAATETVAPIKAVKPTVTAAPLAIAAPTENEETIETEEVIISDQVTPAEPNLDFASACAECSGNCCTPAKCGGGMCCSDRCAPVWTVNAGALILQRSRPGLSPIVRGADLRSFLNAHDFGPNWATGVDIQAIRRFRNGHGLEARYFGIDGWQSHRFVPDVPGILIPTTPPLIGAPGATLDANYRSQLYNAEVNYWLPAGNSSWLTFLAGFRWVELHENLNVGINFPPGFQANMAAYSNNHLYGGQLGSNMLLWDRGGPFRLNCTGKAGVYGNAASSNFQLTQPSGPAFVAGDRAGQTAFVGDISAAASYQLTEHIALRAGYQLLWLQGVATAGDQIAATNILTNNGIQTLGGVFYQGAIASANFTW